jgi:hypothetical protein
VPIDLRHAQSPRNGRVGSDCYGIHQEQTCGNDFYSRRLGNRIVGRGKDRWTKTGPPTHLQRAPDRVELVSVRRFNFGSAESKWLEKRHPQQNFVLPTIWTAARRHACGLRPWELLFTIRNRRSLRLVLVRAVNCFKMPCASTESCPGALSLAARCAVKLAVPSGSQAKPTRGRSPAKQTLIWRGSDSIESFHEPGAPRPSSVGAVPAHITNSRKE